MKGEKTYNIKVQFLRYSYQKNGGGEVGSVVVSGYKRHFTPPSRGGKK